MPNTAATSPRLPSSSRKLAGLQGKEGMSLPPGHWHPVPSILCPRAGSGPVLHLSIHPPTWLRGDGDPGDRVPEQSWDTIPAAPMEMPALHQQGQAQEHGQLPETQPREQ